MFYLPYLMGERSPHNDPSARAAFIGMSMDSTREDMTQAVLEGVAFGLRDSLEVARSIGVESRENKDLRRWSKESAVEKDHCKCDEYESRSDRKRRRLRAMEAAILAAVGCGVFDSVEEAAKETCESNRNRRTGSGTGAEVRGKISGI